MNLSFSDIKHLDSILSKLECPGFSKAKWEKFGLKCGLYHSTLETIQANNPKDVDKCFTKCVALWLEKKDDVDGKGEPTLERLAKIVEEIGDKATAEKIRSQFREEHNCKGQYILLLL